VDKVFPPPVSLQTAARIRGAFGSAGERWLDGLADRVARTLERYDLRAGTQIDASYSYVQFVRVRSGEEFVLKLAPPGPEFEREMDALRVWGGRSVPRVRAADRTSGVLLIDRVRPGTALARRPEEDAAGVISEVARMLAAEVRGPFPGGVFTPVESLRTAFERARNLVHTGDSPIPPATLEEADDAFRDLLKSSAPPVLLHGDLHHWNVVDGGEKGWTAIDPKGYVGEAAYEYGAFLRNPVGAVAGWRDLESVQRRRIGELADATGLDATRIRGWGFAQAVLSACWSIEDGSGEWESALTCADALRAAR